MLLVLGSCYSPIPVSESEACVHAEVLHSEISAEKKAREATLERADLGICQTWLKVFHVNLESPQAVKMSM